MADSVQKSARQRLLIVGLACVDFINVAGHYPEEDTDQRLLDQRISRGGNATNTSIILAQLGSPVEWLGTVARDKLADVIIEDLSGTGVLHDHICYHDNCKTPVSCVIISTQSGSRTILHANKTLPELDVSDFSRLDLENYSWIHFEGRNQTKVEQMIKRIEEFNERRQSLGLETITVSIEAEKPKAISREFLSRGDYVFISKEYSNSLGQSSAEECLKHLKTSGLLKRGARAICAWGEKGAWGLEENGTIVHSKAYPPIRVVDTLGAGDTFNGGVLHALSIGKSLEEALKLGCQVAGQKVGQNGFLINIGALDSHLLHAS
ncbi:ketohexokinase-like [Diadema antillarum]|uniref:ketohexokinase-like n=1 Tax=Diadema antillarum TaxID=105358 RepID=UPI003A87D739